MMKEPAGRNFGWLLVFSESRFILEYCKFECTSRSRLLNLGGLVNVAQAQRKLYDEKTNWLFIYPDFVGNACNYYSSTD